MSDTGVVMAIVDLAADEFAIDRVVNHIPQPPEGEPLTYVFTATGEKADRDIAAFLSSHWDGESPSTTTDQGTDDMTDETPATDLFDGDIWLTPDELADWLKLRKDWVYDQVQADRLPFHKFGRQLRFRKSEITDWLNNRRPISSAVSLTITWPDGRQTGSSLDLRDLMAVIEPEPQPEPEPVEEPTIVAEIQVDEAGLEVQA